MALEQIFYVCQSIAGLAIVVSLLFVGLEVRHANAESRYRAIEELQQDYRDLRFQIFANADSAGVWLRGLHEFAALNAVDRVRFELVVHGFFGTFQSAFLNYRGGRMTREMYQPQEKNLDDFLAYPGLQSAWSIRKAYFHKEFRALVDAKIAAIPSSGMVPPYERTGRE